MASIEERDKSWRVRWRDLAGKPRSRRCPDRKTARRLKAEVERALALGGDWAAADSRSRTEPDVSAVVADYLADCARRLTAGTITNIRLTLGHLLDFLGPDGPAPVALISRDNLHRWHGQQLGLVDVRTAATKLSRASAFWRWASQDSDAWESIVPRWRRVDPGSVPPGRPIPAPTLDEVDRAIAAAAYGPEWTRRTFLIQRFQGLRAGQIWRLDWSDFDLDGKRLTIRPELGKSRSEKRGRTVPLHPELAQEMAGWGLREGLVIPLPSDTRGRPKTARTAWRRAGVEVRQPFHGVRHAVATHLRVAGVAEDVVGALLGHAPTVTSAHYIDPAAMWPLLVDALALLPPVGVHRVSGVKGRQRKVAKPLENSTPAHNYGMNVSSNADARISARRAVLSDGARRLSVVSGGD